MKTTTLELETKNHLEELYQRFLNDEKIKRMLDIPMHRGSNCYIHSFKVAKLAIKRALRRKKKHLALENILVAGILHDYYLYNWRNNHDYRKKHARKHPYVASENAGKDFGINNEIKRIIETHMWPINFSDFPSSTEARIVNNADTSIAFKEAMTSIKYKMKRKQKDLEFISHLF